MHIQVRAYVTGYYLLTKQLVKVKSAKQLGSENTPAGLLDIFKTISVKVFTEQVFEAELCADDSPQFHLCPYRLVEISMIHFLKLMSFLAAVAMY